MGVNYLCSKIVCTSITSIPKSGCDFKRSDELFLMFFLSLLTPSHLHKDLSCDVIISSGKFVMRFFINTESHKIENPQNGLILELFFFYTIVFLD